MHLLRLVAPLAAALALATPPASAATLSVDLPGCSQVALTGTGPNYTLTCTQAAMTCVAQASPISPNGGTATNLTVACSPAATAVSWSASRDCTLPSGGAVGQASVTEVVGGRSCVYTASATAPGFTGSASVAVVWQGTSTAVPPTGCTVTRTPASGSLGTSGGPVTMSASCSGGGAVTSWSWRKGTTTGWATTQTANDTVPANTGSAAITHTYAVTACAGGACAPEVLATFTVAGSAPVGFCSQYSDVRIVDLTWGGYIDTGGSGGVGVNAGTVLVGRLSVPANASSPTNSPGLISIVEHMAGQANRVMSISAQPCDFRGYSPGFFPPQDPNSANAPMGWDQGINPNRQFLLTGDPAGSSPAKPLFTPGQTYYVNLQTINFLDGQNSCTTSTCDVRITVNAPR